MPGAGTVPAQVQGRREPGVHRGRESVHQPGGNVVGREERAEVKTAHLVESFIQGKGPELDLERDGSQGMVSGEPLPDASNLAGALGSVQSGSERARGQPNSRDGGTRFPARCLALSPGGGNFASREASWPPPTDTFFEKLQSNFVSQIIFSY